MNTVLVAGLCGMVLSWLLVQALVSPRPGKPTATEVGLGFLFLVSFGMTLAAGGAMVWEGLQ
jgi:hypothetical protein